MSHTRKATIVVPIYNEVDSVEEEIQRLLESEFINDFELIIVDDGSTDGTGEKLDEIVEKNKGKFALLHHEFNKGYGAALKTGIVEASTEDIIITDADNSYPNDRIPELHQLYIDGNFDMVVGARTKTNAAIPLIRKPAKWCLNMLANYLTRAKIPDLNSGLRVFKKNIAIENFNLICDGFSFTTTITLIMFCNSYRVKYIPIEYYTRAGSSKIKPIRDTLNFIYLILSTVLYFRPMRIFFPIGVLVFMAGIGLGIYQAIALRNITTVTVLLLQSGFYLLTIALLADMISKNRKVTHVRHLRDS